MVCIRLALASMLEVSAGNRTPALGLLLACICKPNRSPYTRCHMQVSFILDRAC
ncbi:MAG: hypothetical protein QXI92_04145 [Candidatus Nitrosocaldus sp.]